MKKYIKSALISIICVICVLFLSSCSPQKRLERLLRKYPELISRDTVDFTALVPVPAKASQFEININLKDTMIELRGDDNIILTYYITQDSIIEVFVQVPPDTIAVPVQVPVEKIKVIRPDYWNQLIDKLPYISMAIIALILSGFFLYRKK